MSDKLEKYTKSDKYYAFNLFPFLCRVRVQYKWVGGLTSRLEPYTPPSSTPYNLHGRVPCKV